MQPLVGKPALWRWLRRVSSGEQTEFPFVQGWKSNAEQADGLCISNKQS